MTICRRREREFSEHFGRYHQPNNARLVVPMTPSLSLCHERPTTWCLADRCAISAGYMISSSNETSLGPVIPSQAVSIQLWISSIFLIYPDERIARGSGLFPHIVGEFHMNEQVALALVYHLPLICVRRALSKTDGEEGVSCRSVTRYRR